MDVKLQKYFLKAVESQIKALKPDIYSVKNRAIVRANSSLCSALSSLQAVTPVFVKL